MKPLQVLIVAAWLTACGAKNLRGAQWYEAWKGRIGTTILDNGPPAIGDINDSRAMGINAVAAAAAATTYVPTLPSSSGSKQSTN